MKLSLLVYSKWRVFSRPMCCLTLTHNQWTTSQSVECLDRTVYSTSLWNQTSTDDSNQTSDNYLPVTIYLSLLCFCLRFALFFFCLRRPHVHSLYTNQSTFDMLKMSAAGLDRKAFVINKRRLLENTVYYINSFKDMYLFLRSDKWCWCLHLCILMQVAQPFSGMHCTYDPTLCVKESAVWLCVEKKINYTLTLQTQHWQRQPKPASWKHTFVAWQHRWHQQPSSSQSSANGTWVLK